MVESNTLGIAIASLLVLITCVAYFILTARRSAVSTKRRDPALFIAGPSNSGKTALFTLLTTGNVRNSVTSQDTNIKKNYESKVSLIDFPGHVKLHYKLLDALRDTEHIKGLVFVIDATTDPKKLTDTAEFLLDILTVTEVAKEPVDILLACNKSESFTARPPAKIKEALEREIGFAIERHTKSLSEVKKRRDLGNGDEDNDDETAGFLDNMAGSNAFTFSMLEGTVDALDGSVVKKNISKWEDWLDSKLSA